MTVDRLPFIPAWLDDADLTAQEVRILIHILRRGECYESIIAIARHCRISHHTVRASMKILRSKGFLKEVSRRGQTTIYTGDFSTQPLLKEEGPPTISGRGSAPTPPKIGRGPLLNQEGDPYQNRKTKDTPLKDTPSKVNKGGVLSKFRKEAESVLAHLNEKAGRSYRPVDAQLSPIATRLAGDGITVDGIKEMIDSKVVDWKGTDFEKFLQPSTLFKTEKFHERYDDRNRTRTKPNGRHRAPTEDDIDQSKF